MDEKIRQGNIEKRTLLEMLNKRMSEVLHRRQMLQKNEFAITRAYRLYMLPLEIWNDFEAAKESLQSEMMKIKMLTDKFGVSFKDLLERAQAKYLSKRRQSSVSHGSKGKTKEKKKGKHKRRSLSNISSSRSQSPMTAGDRAEAKGIRRRRKY